MKFKKCSDTKRLELRKGSVKRMHRPHKFEDMLSGRAKYERVFGFNLEKMDF